MEQLRKTPFLILGNKIDHRNAVSEDELRHQMNLWHTTGKGKVPLDDIRPIEVFMCSVVMRQGALNSNPLSVRICLLLESTTLINIEWWAGYGEGIRWLSQYV